MRRRTGRWFSGCLTVAQSLSSLAHCQAKVAQILPVMWLMGESRHHTHCLCHWTYCDQHEETEVESFWESREQRPSIFQDTGHEKKRKEHPVPDLPQGKSGFPAMPVGPQGPQIRSLRMSTDLNQRVKRNCPVLGLEML